ncbi:MAG: hypothetical protein ACI4KA_02610 [Oscillospiraceae bacterium]
MAKKRNCRRTPEEVSIHEEAVKLRKMTDAQLVEKVRSALNATSNASTKFDELGKAANRTAEFLEALNNANIPGIGKVTKKKLSTFAKENGYI